MTANYSHIQEMLLRSIGLAGLSLALVSGTSLGRWEKCASGVVTFYDVEEPASTKFGIFKGSSIN